MSRVAATATIDIIYKLNGCDEKQIIRNLQQLIEEAAGNGRLSGETPLEVETWDMSIRIEDMIDDVVVS
jgi:hypothetical protein